MIGFIGKRQQTLVGPTELVLIALSPHPMPDALLRFTSSDLFQKN